MLVVAHKILVSALGPFGFKWVLDLFGTWLGLGLGLGGFGTKGLRPGLDNFWSSPQSLGVEGREMAQTWT